MSLVGWYILLTFAKVCALSGALKLNKSTMQQSSSPSAVVDDRNWYVLLVAYRTELKVKGLLQELGNINAFVPMKRVRRRDKQGKFCYEEKVALNNYVFVHASYKFLQQLKANHPDKLDYNFLYRDVYEGMKKVGRTPAVVPRQQMLNFIAVVGNYQERVQFLDERKLDLKAGQRVRVILGPFAGVEGVYLSTTRKHERRVVVRLEGIATVATTALPSAFVEVIEDEVEDESTTS